jgi:hypothetical protein
MTEGTIIAPVTRKKYGMKGQSIEGDYTTATFKTLKGTRAFIHDRLISRDMRVFARERVRTSKAKRPVYVYVLKYLSKDYDNCVDRTLLTELDEFFRF